MVHMAPVSCSIFLKHRVGRILTSDYRFATVKKQNKTKNNYNKNNSVK